MAVIGIDLGTTNSVAARTGQVIPLSDDALPVLPSVVSFLPNGTTQIGRTARRRRVIDFENTIFSSKRIIGRRWSDTTTREFRERYPFEMVEGPHQVPLFSTRAGDHSAVEIASLVLNEVGRWTDCGAADDEAHITIPAMFTGVQREATLEAAKLAGLRSAKLISESLATVYAYRDRTDLGRAVVYDLGGGTFDCSVVDCTTPEPELLAHANDLFLGGDDVDEHLARWVCKHVLEKYNWDLANYREIRDRLVARCEEAKIELSRDERTTIELSQIDPECPAAAEGVEVSRSLLEGLCEDLVRRTLVTCDDALARAKLRPHDIDTVLLAGGTALLPTIQRSVATYFGREGLLEFDPCEVVALGASLAPPVDVEKAR